MIEIDKIGKSSPSRLAGEGDVGSEEAPRLKDGLKLL